MSSPKLNTDIRVRVEEDVRRGIEEVADERSEPGDRVTNSDVIREALRDYLDEYDAPDGAEPEEQPAD